MIINNLLIGLLLFCSVTAYGSERFIVKNISFKGLRHVTTEDALLSVPIGLGDVVDHKIISNIIQTLFSTGKFEDICILRDDNDTLVIQVKERPIIANITLSGNKLLKDDVLRKYLNTAGIQIGELFNHMDFHFFKKNLINYYYSVGKYNANIETIITPLPNNCVDIQLVLQEGISTGIKKIIIVGNHVFKTKELLSNFQLCEKVSWWNIIRNCNYQKQKLINDLQNLKIYYFDHGYAKFDINSTQVDFTSDKKDVYITINVTEGNQYRLSSSTVEGELAGFSKEIENITKIESGELYSNIKIEKIKENIRKLFYFHGYIYPCIQVYPEINDINKSIKLHINVNSGNRFCVRKIHFEGNNISKDSVLRREIHQMEGVWLKGNLISQGKEQLKRLGYFETVDVDIQRIPDSLDQVDIIYRVKERNTGNFNFGAGYGTESGVNFRVGIQQDNWLGTGHSIGIHGTKNYYQTHFELFTNNPYFTINGISLGGRCFYKNFKSNEIDISSYAKKSYGLDSTVGIPINEYNKFHLNLSYVHNDISNIKPQIAIWRYLNSINRDIITNFSKNKHFIVNDFIFDYNWIYDKLDHFFFPTCGSHINLNGKISIPGSDNEFYKVILNTSSYYPIDKKNKWIILSHIRLGYGNGFRRKEMPFYENFYAGGSNTVRGFQSNNIGPKAIYFRNNKKYNIDKTSFDEIYDSTNTIGGNAMVITNLELIIPIPFVNEKYEKLLRTSLFIDIGTVWDTNWKNTIQTKINKIPDYSDPSKIRISAGTSLKWMSPLGLLEFSYAKPYKKYDGDKIEQFQFNIGKTW